VATSTTALASVTTASVTTPAVVPTTLLPPARVGGLVSLPPIGSSPSVQVTLVQLVDPGVGTISNPVAGDRYVGVQLRVKNTGTAPAQQDLNGDTMIEDSQGNLYSPIDVALQNCPALGAGRSGVGCVTFEVSAAAMITDVTFTPLGQFGNVTAEWRVQ